MGKKKEMNEIRIKKKTLLSEQRLQAKYMLINHFISIILRVDL